LTHKELGTRVFPELSAPHQKIKKIESDKYEPKPDELKALADALDVAVSEIKRVIITPMQDDRLFIEEKVFDYLPSLEGDIKIINQAAQMDREETALTIIEVVLKNSLRTIEQKLKSCKQSQSDEEEDIGSSSKIAHAR
jgi:transcriptional regulator with XRE-family HTH domain